LDRAPQQTCIQSAVGGVYTHEGGEERASKREILRFLSLSNFDINKRGKFRGISGKSCHQARALGPALILKKLSTAGVVSGVSNIGIECLLLRLTTNSCLYSDTACSFFVSSNVL